MPLRKTYSWEVTHVTTVLAVIATLTVVTHMTGTPRLDLHAPGGATTALPITGTHPVAVSPRPGAHPSQHSDPREIVVGATSISSRYKLGTYRSQVGVTHKGRADHQAARGEPRDGVPGQPF